MFVGVSKTHISLIVRLGADWRSSRDGEFRCGACNRWGARRQPKTFQNASSGVGRMNGGEKPHRVLSISTKYFR